VIEGTCKICKKKYTLSEKAHPIFREYCPEHHINIYDEVDPEVLE
jgi:hypothetical protein